MKSFLKLVGLMFGLFLFSVGLLLAIHSRLGAAPWDTFQVGLAGITGLSLGRVSQLIGAAIIIIDIAIKQVPGRGTVLNMYFVGYFIDLIEKYSLIPDIESLFGRTVMLLCGIFVVSWGTFFYVNAGWGAGPRDSLMLGLSRLFSTKVWKARTAIEICVALAGLALGARLGVGTVILAVLVGPAVQLAYRIGGIDPATVTHKTFVDDYRALVALSKGTPPSESLPR
jgi:uncharacterized membrane protein YczE